MTAIGRHRVVRISPVRGWNTCSRCGRPARAEVRKGRIVRVHSPVPVPVVPMAVG